MKSLSIWFADIGWNDGVICLAFVLIMIIIVLLVFGKKKEQAVQQVHLRDLSNLWTKEGGRSIHISELSPLWRAEEPSVQNDEELQLYDPRAAAFMEKIRTWAWFKKFPQQQKVCGQILTLVDKEGHCPSVVDIHGDVEGGWDENTYQILAKTTLLDHSLNVAEMVVHLLSESKAWHVIPDTMVAALAHDLGKLESVRGYLYSLGEHPLAAGRPLASITGFKELPKKRRFFRQSNSIINFPRDCLPKP